MSAMIYVGPTLSGLRQNEVFRDGVPANLTPLLEQYPEIAILLVPVSQAPATMAASRRKGTPEYEAYRKLSGGTAPGPDGGGGGADRPSVGSLAVKLIESDIAMPVDIQGVSLINSGEELPVKQTGSRQILTSVLNVAVAGNRVQLPNYPCRLVTVIAKDTNTGFIYAGSNNVSSSVYGVKLKPDASYDFEVSNANMIWIDASVSGEGISFVAL
ncbi:hypothetical protein ABEV74_11060 [Paenibacillus cisolokensis]|uniref:hypothetical protein n=1 Tax=Paenibacillus cisolokensis TaxID=1658519 RepID=UPI003D2C5AAF